MAIISVLAELERIGWGPIQPLSGDEIRVRCAFHDDSQPSCTINTQKLVFSCKAGSCGVEGDFITFFARALSTGGKTIGRAEVIADFAKRYDLEQVKPVDASVVEKYHQAIWDQKHLLNELYLRGVTDADIRRHRLGFGQDRVTIPVKNDNGVYVNIRFYMPGAPTKKFVNLRGRGDIRLFMPEQLKHPTVALVGGEVKAIVAARVLNPHDCGAVSATAGEGKWHHSLTDRFRGKRVPIIMDVDKAGQESAQKYAAILRSVAEWVGVAQLPLDRDRYPKGDVNDFVASEGGDLWSLVQQTPEWFPAFEAPKLDDAEEPSEKKFSEVIMSENVGRRVRFDAVVSAVVDKPFVVPKRVLVDCDKRQEVCSLCAVYRSEQKTYHVSSESPAILQMIDVPQDKLDGAIRNALGVPKACAVVKFQTSDYYSAWDARVNPSLDISNRDSDKTMQQAVCVECDADLNTTYRMVGRMYPHPKTQAATLLLSRSEATHDALTKYKPKDLQALRVFRPHEWTAQAIQERLDDIYGDLEVNVTRIYLRRDIHLLTDLAYHSPLVLSVDGKRTKGWVEVLIAGDTRHGKSEVTEKLMNHYQLGERVPCKGISVAGLIGGLKQMGTQWYVSWGVIPTHDRRLVILEELKGTSVEVISSLTDMRSSGVAQMTKIEKRRTSARTRLIAVSNPRGNRKVASYAFGVELIKDLIGAPEDISRFDAALIVADDEIDSRRLDAIVRDPPKQRHRYTSDLCRDLVLWSWTRLQDDVAFPRQTRDAISEWSGKLTGQFSDAVPLVDRGSTRDKLARLSAALACRLFCTGDTELQALVLPCHVEYVGAMLERVYSSKTFGYSFYSAAVKTTSQMIDPQQIKAYMQSMQHPGEVRDQLLYNDEIDQQDLSNYSGMDKELASQFMSLLVRKRCVRRLAGGRFYAKTPDFISFLRKVEFAEVPKHIIEDPKEKF